MVISLPKDANRVTVIGGVSSSDGTTPTTIYVDPTTHRVKVDLPSGGITIGTSTISGGTDTRVLYDNAGVVGEYQITGTGKVVMDTSPTLTTPNIGAATATSVNKVAVTAPATASTLTIADGKTLTASNSITLAGTDGKGINVGAATSGKILVGDGTNMVLSTPTFPNASATSGKTIRSDGTNWVASTATLSDAPSTAGKVVVSDGTNWITSTPTFPNASASSGKFIRSDGTNWIASTPTLPTSAGTSGKHLMSDGTNYIETTPTYPNSATSGKILVGDGTNIVLSTPTYPNASATSGKVIKSDGTNFVASTETYAAPGTSGNVMTSDGTNWTSAAASGGAITLLHTGSGTDATTTATTVDTYALSGLTQYDTIKIMFAIASATQPTATPMIYSTTDSATLLTLNSSALGTGTSDGGEIVLNQEQSANTAILATASTSSNSGTTTGSNASVSGAVRAQSSSVTTAWTGSWTIGLRHGGVTSGGTFKWRWMIYKIAGQ